MNSPINPAPDYERNTEPGPPVDELAGDRARCVNFISLCSISFCVCVVWVLMGTTLTLQEKGLPFWCWLGAAIALAYARVKLEKWRRFLVSHPAPAKRPERLASYEREAMEQSTRSKESREIR